MDFSGIFGFETGACFNCFAIRSSIPRRSNRGVPEIEIGDQVRVAKLPRLKLKIS